MNDPQELEKPLNKTIETLKSSPLFNLSLSSKELFHSNFLHWICMKYPAEFGKILVKKLDNKPVNSKIKKSYRERGNIDLTIEFEEGNRKVFIENKVKSLPTETQLKEYSLKLKKEKDTSNFIILSLSKPTFFKCENKKEIEGVTWKYLSFSELSEMLSEILNELSRACSESDYHKSIINDYRVFIQGLVKINECLKWDKEASFLSVENSTSPYPEFYKDIVEIRMHDFYQKRKFEQFARLVYESLKDQDKDLVIVDTPLNWNVETPTIYISHGMSNSKGQFDLKFLIQENISLGIQIEGNQYRMVVEDVDGTIAKEFAKELLNKKLWFDFSRSFEGFENKFIYPKESKQKNTNSNKVEGFNSYNNHLKNKTFLYKYVKIETTLKMEDIVYKIKADVDWIKSNTPLLLKRLKECKNTKNS